MLIYNFKEKEENENNFLCNFKPTNILEEIRMYKENLPHCFVKNEIRVYICIYI